MKTPTKSKKYPFGNKNHTNNKSYKKKMMATVLSTMTVVGTFAPYVPVVAHASAYTNDFTNGLNGMSFAGDWQSSNGVFRSASILDGETSSASFSFDAGTTGGTVSFKHKVSSESEYDYGRVYIDGQEVISVSGDYQDWNVFSKAVSGGTHIVTFEYSKDGSVSNGSDAFYIDDLSVPGIPSSYLPDIIPPANATFGVSVPSGNTQTVSIHYPSDASVKEFKVGEDGEWTLYTSTITAQAGTMIYARSTDSVGNVSNVTSYFVDLYNPVVTITPSTTEPTNNDIIMTVNASDDTSVDVVKWAYGDQTISYFSNGAGTLLTGTTFTADRNGVYSVYVKDHAGKQMVQKITVSNLQRYFNDFNNGLNGMSYNGSGFYAGYSEFRSEGTTSGGNAIIYFDAGAEGGRVSFDYGMVNGDNAQILIDGVEVSAVTNDGTGHFSHEVEGGVHELKIVYVGGMTWYGDYEDEYSDLGQFYIDNLILTGILLDRTPPTDASFSYSSVSGNNALVSIQYPSDANVKEYKLGSNGTWTSYTAPVNVPDGTVVYARSFDASGNESRTTQYLTDYYAPTMTLTPSTTQPTTQDMTVQVDATDTNGIAQVRWLKGNQSAYTMRNSGTLLENHASFTPNESGTYTVYAKDTTGRESVQTITITNLQKYFTDFSSTTGFSFLGNGFNVSNGTFASTGNTNGGHAEVYFDAGTEGGTLSFDYSMYNGDNAKILLDGVEIGAVTADGSGKFTKTVTGGVHKLKFVYSGGVRYVDYGDWDYDTFVGTFNVDNLNLPGILLDRTPPVDATYRQGTISGNTAPITITYPSDGAVKEYKLGASGAWTSYNAPVSVPDGTILYARSIDNAGNVSNVTQFVADYFAPTISLTPSTTASTLSDVVVTVNATDSNGISLLKWAKGTQTASYFNTSGTVITGNTFNVPANGTYTVYAKDTTGKTAVQTIIVTNIQKYVNDFNGGINGMSYTGNGFRAYNNTFYADGNTGGGTATMYFDAGVEGGTLSFDYGMNVADGDHATILVDGVVVGTINGGYTTFSKSVSGGVHTLTINYVGTSYWADEWDDYPTVGSFYIDNLMLPGQLLDRTPPVDASFAYSNDTLTINYPVDGAIKEYKVGDNGVWQTYTTAFAPQDQTTIYARSTDSAGNISNVTNYVVDATAPVITLSPSTTEDTLQDVVVTVNVSDFSSMATKKWATGNQPLSYFTSSGNTLNGTTFTASSNGTYTVYAKDAKGNASVQTITISNIKKLVYDFENGLGGLQLTGDWGIVTYNGSKMLANRDIADSQLSTSTLSFDGGTTGGKVEFDHIISSESNYDFGTVLLDGVQVIKVSGSGTNHYSGNVGAGTHTLVFKYTKDGSVTNGNDSFYIDNLVLPTVATPPATPTLSENVTTLTNQNVLVTATFPTTSVSDEYRVNGGAWTAYTGAITVQSNGWVEARAKNSAGTYSAIATLTITNIDKTAPINPNIYASTMAPTNQDVVVGINYPVDAVVKEYKIGANGTWATYTGSIVLPANDTVYARAYDQATNCSNEVTFEVTNIDKVAPDRAVASLNESMNEFSLTDPNTDTQLIEYQMNDNGWVTYTHIVDLPDGAYTFNVRVLDRAGNVSPVSTVTGTLYGQQLQTATQAVQQAEATSSSTDLATAKSLVNVLPSNATEKEELANRLDTVQQVIDVQVTVSSANDSFDLVQLETASEMVQTLPDGDQKTKLEEQIEQARASINAYYKQVQVARDAVSKAESTKTREDVSPAKTLVTALPSGAIKVSLQNRLYDVEQSIVATEKEDQAYTSALSLVETAELSQLDTDVLTAKTAVSKLDASTRKSALMNRLDSIQVVSVMSDADKARLLSNAKSDVYYAETLKNTSSIQKALDILYVLPDSADKQSLVDRMAVVQDGVDAKNQAYQNATELIQQARQTLNLDNYNTAYATVQALPTGTTKTNDYNQLSVIKYIIDLSAETNVNTLDFKVNNAVTNAELFKRDPYISKAQGAINLLPDTVADKASLQARLDMVNGAYQASTLQATLDTAIKKVGYAEKYKTASYMDDALEAVLSLPDSNDKTSLMTRLNAIDLGLPTEEIVTQRALQIATRYVDNAEAMPTDTRIANAYIKVNTLADTVAQKTELKIRLDQISKAYYEKVAENKVVLAEKYRTAYYYNLAKQKTDALADSDKKAELEARLVIVASLLPQPKTQI